VHKFILIIYNLQSLKFGFGVSRTACVLEKTGNENMHIFIKVGGRLRGERLT